MTNIAQVKNGIRNQDMPRARKLMIVVMKFTEPNNDAEMLKTIAINHQV